MGREREQRSSYGGDDAIKLSDKVNDDNKDKALMARNMPFRASIDEIIEFFAGHGDIKEENVTVEEMNGRKTGSVLIVFESTEKAQAAKEALNGQELSGRSISIFDKDDSMMQKICRL